LEHTLQIVLLQLRELAGSEFDTRLVINAPSTGKPCNVYRVEFRKLS